MQRTMRVKFNEVFIVERVFRSIREKCVYVNSNNLAGAMIWSIDTDDFRGDCGQENALLNTVNSVLRAEPRVSN